MKGPGLHGVEHLGCNPPSSPQWRKPCDYAGHTSKKLTGGLFCIMLSDTWVELTSFQHTRLPSGCFLCRLKERTSQMTFPKILLTKESANLLEYQNPQTALAWTGTLIFPEPQTLNPKLQELVDEVFEMCLAFAASGKNFPAFRSRQCEHAFTLCLKHSRLQFV